MLEEYDAAIVTLNSELASATAKTHELGLATASATQLGVEDLARWSATVDSLLPSDMSTSCAELKEEFTGALSRSDFSETGYFGEIGTGKAFSWPAQDDLHLFKLGEAPKLSKVKVWQGNGSVIHALQLEFASGIISPTLGSKTQYPASIDLDNRRIAAVETGSDEKFQILRFIDDDGGVIDYHNQYGFSWGARAI